MFLSSSQSDTILLSDVVYSDFVPNHLLVFQGMSGVDLRGIYLVSKTGWRSPMFQVIGKRGGGVGRGALSGVKRGTIERERHVKTVKEKQEGQQ